MSKQMRLVVLLLGAALLAGCSSHASWVRMDPEAGLPDGTYMRTVDTKDRCAGAVRSYDYEVTVKGGQIVGEPKLIGKHGITGTCQQILVGVAKGVLPSLATWLAGRDRSDALEAVAATNAAAAIHNAQTKQETSKYAVDNAKASRTYNIDDSDYTTNIFTETELEVNNIKTSSDCGNGACSF